MNEIKIETDIIKLDSFLKWAGIACIRFRSKILYKK